MTKTPKRPRDPAQLAKFIVDVATGEVDQTETPRTVRARKGGIAGGPARARSLTDAQRADIAREAASARWKKKGGP